MPMILPQRPGGANTQLQFNDAGAAAGAAGLTWDKTASTLTHASGTRTTSAPIQALSQTWNASGVTFTGWSLNITDTASSAFSLLASLQIGGVTQFSVRKDGLLLVNSRNSPSALVGLAGSSGLSSTLMFLTNTGATAGSVRMVGAQTGVHTAGVFGFTTNANASDSDLLLHRISAGVIGQHNGTSAQGHQWYGTRTDASNYRRLSAGMSNTGAAYLRAEGAGTGASGNTLAVSTGVLTVASLPPASSVPYTRLAVTDATATTWMSAVAGGGSNKVPVWSDGTQWRIA